MTSATIKLFLPRGDAKSLRTAEISNWTGQMKKLSNQPVMQQCTRNGHE
jgi:hypothetical protein